MSVHAIDVANSAISQLQHSLAIDAIGRIAAQQIAEFRNHDPQAAIVRQVGALGTQVARLRWMFPDGRTPVVLMPSTPTEFLDLSVLAYSIAREWLLPSVVTIEQALVDEILRSPPELREGERGVMHFDRADSTSILNTPDAEIRLWESRVRGNAQRLARSRMDKQPASDARVDWLVVSYGHTAQAAQLAVEQARAQGLGVDHLVLQTLSPLPERAITTAAMGKKFVVVPERNVGQLHSEIQRLCPSLPCVLVQSAIVPVTTQQVLDALLRFPRCC